MAREATEISFAEDDAREALAAVRLAGREQRDVRRKAEKERRKQE